MTSELRTSSTPDLPPQSSFTGETSSKSDKTLPKETEAEKSTPLKGHTYSLHIDPDINTYDNIEPLTAQKFSEFEKDIKATANSSSLKSHAVVIASNSQSSEVQATTIRKTPNNTNTTPIAGKASAKSTQLKIVKEIRIINTQVTTIFSMLTKKELDVFKTKKEMVVKLKNDLLNVPNSNLNKLPSVKSKLVTVERAIHKIDLKLLIPVTKDSDETEEKVKTIRQDIASLKVAIEGLRKDVEDLFNEPHTN